MLLYDLYVLANHLDLLFHHILPDLRRIESLFTSHLLLESQQSQSLLLATVNAGSDYRFNILTKITFLIKNKGIVINNLFMIYIL